MMATTVATTTAATVMMTTTATATVASATVATIAAASTAKGGRRIASADQGEANNREENRDTKYNNSVHSGILQ
jgi:hypothetical protein